MSNRNYGNKKYNVSKNLIHVIKKIIGNKNPNVSNYLIGDNDMYVNNEKIGNKNCNVEMVICPSM